MKIRIKKKSRRDEIFIDHLITNKIENPVGVKYEKQKMNYVHRR